MVGSTSICYRRDQSLQDVLVKGLGSVKGGGWEWYQLTSAFARGAGGLSIGTRAGVGKR